MAALIHVFRNDAHERDFTMRVVKKGDRYGREMCLVHDRDDPMVEFYDRGWSIDRDTDGTVLGQFVSRYNLATLLEPDIDGRTAFEWEKLTLDGGTGWAVSGSGLKSCLAVLVEAGLCPDLTEAREARIAAEMRAAVDSGGLPQP